MRFSPLAYEEEDNNTRRSGGNLRWDFPANVRAGGTGSRWRGVRVQRAVIAGRGHRIEQSFFYGFRNG